MHDTLSKHKRVSIKCQWNTWNSFGERTTNWELLKRVHPLLGSARTPNGDANNNMYFKITTRNSLDSSPENNHDKSANRFYLESNWVLNYFPLSVKTTEHVRHKQTTPATAWRPEMADRRSTTHNVSCYYTSKHNKKHSKYEFRVDYEIK